jgi:uncharacterized protein
VPLLVAETSSRRLRSLAAQQTDMLVWWASEVECVSALARREREGAFDDRTVALVLQRLKQLAQARHEIDPSDVIRETAERFLRVHPLRTADALQLAAAFAAAEGRPASLDVVTLDDRFATAARKEGFAVVALTDD